MIRDPIDIKNSNVWQNATKPTEQQINLTKRTMIVLGEQKAGKTSFIKLVKGDYDLDAKPTRLIDFYTMKKQGVEVEIYQISSPKFQSALQFMITPQNCSQLTIVLCVDLTQPQNLVHKVNTQIQHIKFLLKQIVQTKGLDQVKQYNEQRSKYFHFIQKNDDVEIIKRPPFKFCLVGCKYDLFEKMKLQERKWVCRCLRYLAHTNESNLLFSSTKNMQTAAQLRSVFVQQLLGIRNKLYSNQKDHTKALFILTGEDKIGEMSLPAFNNSGAFNEIKILEQQLESVFPSNKRIEAPPSQSQQAKQFNSIGLDSLIGKYRKEVWSMIKSKGIKVPMGSERNLGMTTQFGGFGKKTMKAIDGKAERNSELGSEKFVQNKQRVVTQKRKEQDEEQEEYMDEGEQDAESDQDNN